MQIAVHKTVKSFSAIALDQCHEQNNAVVKGTGDLSGNPYGRWMVAGPEISRITTNFEGQVLRILNNNQHLEQESSNQQAFAKDVGSLVDVIDEMGNLSLEQSNDILVLDTKDIDDASEAVKNADRLVSNNTKHLSMKDLNNVLLLSQKPCQKINFSSVDHKLRHLSKKNYN